MTVAPLWITEEDVTSMVSLPDAIAALEKILPLEADGEAQNMPKGHLMVAKNDAMHVLGSSVSGEGICGFKNWINVIFKKIIIDGLLLSFLNIYIQKTLLSEAQNFSLE